MSVEPDSIRDRLADSNFPTPVVPIARAGEGNVGPVISSIVVAYLIVLAVVQMYSLLELWPAPTPAGGAPTQTPVHWFVWVLSVSDEVRLLLLVALTGSLGGLLHALRSVAWYIGHEDLKGRWLPTYVTEPFVAATLAILFYLVIRGGFFSPQSTVQQTSPFGFAAMAGLIGLFSPQAVLKLKEVAETVLTKPLPGSDSIPQRSGPEMAPDADGPGPALRGPSGPIEEGSDAPAAGP